MVREELTDAGVEAARGGDADALRTVYVVLAPRILGYLRAHRVHDAEALMQDVFLELLPRIATVTGGAEGVRRLAFTIARARMIDAVRTRTRRPGEVSYDPLLDPRTVESAADEAERAMSLEGIQAVLATLPPEQREVVTLRVVADLSIEQVAAIIGRSPGAVKQLQRRALIKLRVELEQHRSRL